MSHSLFSSLPISSAMCIIRSLAFSSALLHYFLFCFFFFSFISFSSTIFLLWFFCHLAYPLSFLYSVHPKITTLYPFTITLLPFSRKLRLLAAYLALNHPKPLSVLWRHNHSSHSFHQVPISIFYAILPSPVAAWHTMHSSWKLNFVRKAVEEYFSKIVVKNRFQYTPDHSNQI